MQIVFSKVFKKKYKKLPPKLRRQAKERVTLFTQDPFNVVLNNHVLGGKYLGCRSVNVTGDVRAVYTVHKKTTAVFLDIGTHNDLYR